MKHLSSNRPGNGRRDPAALLHRDHLASSGRIGCFLSSEIAVGQVQADIRREVERRFPPEFLNRVDEVVLFSPLTTEEARAIAAQ